MNEKISDLEEKINEQESEIEKLNNLLSEYKEKNTIAERELQYKRTYSASLFEEKEKLEEKILKYKEIVKMKEHEQESKKNEKGNVEKYKDSISQLQKDKIKLQEENHLMQEAVKNISNKIGLMMEEKDKSDEFFINKIKMLEQRSSFHLESKEVGVYEKKLKEVQETYNLIIQSKIEEIQTTHQQNQEANKLICNLRNQISQKENSMKELEKSIDSFRSQLSKEKENNSLLQKNMEIHSLIEKTFTDEKKELELIKKKYFPEELENSSENLNSNENEFIALQEKKIHELLEQISTAKQFDEERANSLQKSLQDNLKIKEDLEKSQSEVSKLTQQNNLLRFEKDELEQKFLSIRNPVQKNGKSHYKNGNNSWLRYLPVVNLFLPKNTNKLLVNGMKNGKKWKNKNKNSLLFFIFNFFFIWKKKREENFVFLRFVFILCFFVIYCCVIFEK